MVSDFLSPILSIRGMLEQSLVVPYRACRSCIRRPTWSWIGTQLVSIFGPGIAVIVYRNRRISRRPFSILVGARASK